MLLGKGRLGNVRLFSPRLIAYVSRNHTGERGDEQMDGIPMHRGLGPHVRGESDRIRGLGTIGAPATFGHGGVGSRIPGPTRTSGVSFTYLTNFVAPDPWHSARLDRVANLVHAAIDSDMIAAGLVIADPPAAFSAWACRGASPLLLRSFEEIHVVRLFGRLAH